MDLFSYAITIWRRAPKVGLGDAKHKQISHAVVPLKNKRKLFRLQAFEVFGRLLRI